MKLSVWKTFNGQILQLRNQGLSLEGIGAKVGVTRERIRQILEEHYGTTMPSGLIARRRLAQLLGCSDGMLEKFENEGKVYPTRMGDRIWYTPEESEKAFLALQAYKLKHEPVLLKCGQCSQEFKLRRGIYNARNRRRKLSLWFHNRHCYGVYCGLHYGFSAQPENIRLGQLKRDSSAVYSLWEQTGSVKHVGEVLGIPIFTIYSILRRYPAYINRPQKYSAVKAPKIYGERELSC